MTRLGVALGVGLALVSAVAKAELIVVSGVVVDDKGQRKDGQPVELCWSGKAGKGCRAKGRTSKSGVFILTLDMAAVPDQLFVLTSGPGKGEAIPVKGFESSSKKTVVSAVADDLVILPCGEKAGSTPADKVPACVSALGSTLRVKELAGAVTPAQVERDFDGGMKTLLATQGWDREAVRVALAALAQPASGTPFAGLKGALRFDLSGSGEQMLAAGSYCSAGVKVARSSAEPYSERSDRCEGAVVLDTAGAVELVSLTAGPFTFDPQRPALELAWAGARSPEVCVRARPTRPDLAWFMNTRVPATRRSFRWSLEAARKGVALPAGSMGVLAEECGQDVTPTYLPLEVTETDGKAPYRAVLLASNKLKDVYVTIEELREDGSRQTVHPRARAPFTSDLRPRITLDIPRAATGSGKYKVTLQLYGVTNQGDGTSSFSFRHD